MAIIVQFIYKTLLLTISKYQINLQRIKIWLYQDTQENLAQALKIPPKEKNAKTKNSKTTKSLSDLIYLDI